MWSFVAFSTSLWQVPRLDAQGEGLLERHLLFHPAGSSPLGPVSAVPQCGPLKLVPHLASFLVVAISGIYPLCQTRFRRSGQLIVQSVPLLLKLGQSFVNRIGFVVSSMWWTASNVHSPFSG